METKPIFNDIQLRKAAFILNNQYAKLSGLTSAELKNLAVVWCYYSGKIEGNTYTYVETEALLKDDITSPKRYEDAKMLKNLYNGFVTVLEQILKNGAIDIDQRTVVSGLHQYTNPMERAVYLHCNIARLQPFIDGNKRTSRLLESIVLMNHNIIPVYSAQDEDLLNYRKGLIHFYETQDYSLYVDYFLNRQIERINSLSLKSDVIFDLQANREI